MKRFKILSFILTIALTISACGAEATPTVNPVDIQNTAIAAAFTIVAETQAAIPTDTPLPTSTQTPLPTDTPIPLPTLEATFTPAAPTKDPNANPCDTRILGSPKGKPTVIRIVNKTKAKILTVSIYLNETPDKFECGWYGFDLSGGDTTLSHLVWGCYNIWAWNSQNDPKPKEHVNASGYGCINNPDKWTFEIRAGSIKFIAP